MAVVTTYKVLGQSKPLAATLTAAYTVPALTQSVVSTIAICNQDPASTTYRIAVAVAGIANDPKQYYAYDVPIAGNSSQFLTIGMTLGPGDVIRVYNTLATLSFNISGSETA